jgi:predicted dehydrogenase
MKDRTINRRQFIETSGTAVAGAMLINPLSGFMSAPIKSGKLRAVLVGTGVRGTTFWGRPLVEQYGDLLEFVGLCDINPGRVEFARQYMGLKCPTFTDFDKMLDKVKPDLVIVTTVDATHHEFIIKGLKFGADVITEKPLTTDEVKCQAILNAERESGKKLTVGFNYRYGTLPTAIKQKLFDKEAGRITSVDFHWYLNVYHGADYFRRWHALRKNSGSLLCHKASHHFDLLNWWIDSEPVEVYAYGMLEHYGKNNTFRGTNCRNCSYTKTCKFYWDMTKDDLLMNLYAANEKHDGYIRDNCLWREEIDIFDKMAVQIKYANDVSVSYSLTTYSPYEGWRVAFNGLNGRIDSSLDIPWRRNEIINQSDLYNQGMTQEKEDADEDYDEIAVMKNFENYEITRVPRIVAGHGGGDEREQENIFRTRDVPDPLKHLSGSRDGAMSAMIGIAARKSIDEKRVVRIEELTDLKPMAIKP